MKAYRLLILAAAAVLVTGAPALAFHDGGVAYCSGCHTMHNSSNGKPMNFNAAGTGPGLPIGQGYTDLLLFENKSDVCLRCHGNNTASYGVWSTDPAAPNVARANRGGGDYVFLQEDNINDGRGGATNPILGHAAGHSIISGIKNTAADPVLTTSPGGTFPANGLACTSCHDPHGTGSYRLLYQDGQRVDTALFTATIKAEGISLSTTKGEEIGNHNAYQEGFSAWCGTCHGDFHQKSSNLIHPSGEPLGSDIATAYNMYKGTTDCIANPPASGLPCGSGVAATAYLPQVPFEDPSNTITSTAGPTSNSRVACVSCHRAHATSAPNSGRWDFNILGMAADGVNSKSYKIPNPYDGGQRSLCNKCHSKDEFDHPEDFTPAP
jgi:predicted CXXCH cytochrome family protein